MAEHNPQRQKATPTATYEAEYQECYLAGERAEYEKFRQTFPAFRGGFEDYREVMQIARDHLRDEAKLAAIEEERRVLRDILLLPLIYQFGQLRVPDESGDELLDPLIRHRRTLEGPTTPDDGGAPAPPGSAEEFSYDTDFRYCHWRGYEFRFSALQARVIKALFEALCRGEPGLSTEALAKASESVERPPEFKVTRLFRGRGRAAIERHFLVRLGAIWTLNLAPKRP